MRLRPRLLIQFLSYLGGYFWLPCPICKRPFSGFEARSDAVLLERQSAGIVLPCTTLTSGQCVCPDKRCIETAKRWNSFTVH